MAQACSFSFFTNKTCTRREFICNQDKKDIVFANFAMIGEAAARISDDLRKAHPDVSWKRSIAMRNVLVHNYMAVDYSIVWDTAMDDLPVLKKQIQKILEEISEK
nr:HepT-like ribonuclease domain-containing protein [uncultured Victivallis sp.]